METLVKRKVILVGILLASTNCCSETLGDNLLNGSIFMIFSNIQNSKEELVVLSEYVFLSFFCQITEVGKESVILHRLGSEIH